MADQEYTRIAEREHVDLVPESAIYHDVQVGNLSRIGAACKMIFSFDRPFCTRSLFNLYIFLGECSPFLSLSHMVQYTDDTNIK